MSKKSFGTQLFQGFIRSAVNQVGRDGGKVISNRVYGNAHSIPIRTARNELPIEYAQAETIEERFLEPSFLSQHGIWYAFILIGCFAISPFAVIYFIANSIKYGLKRKGVVEITKKVENWATDRRLKEGKRFDGYSNKYFYLEAPLTSNAKKTYTIKAILHFLLACFFGWFTYYVWFT